VCSTVNVPSASDAIRNTFWYVMRQAILGREPVVGVAGQRGEQDDHERIGQEPDAPILEDLRQRHDNRQVDDC
jgi:hypothetical protein